MENNKKTVLVLGANGKSGSRIAAQLESLNVNVRRGSRSAMPAFDWEQQATWADALAGMDSVYISFQPDLAVPGAVETIEAFVKEAKSAGVKQLVLLSGRGEPEAQVCEQLVINSGLTYTIIRASWFNQNFTEGHLAEPILAGYVALPTGGMKEPFIDADDIADIAVAALTNSAHNNEVYEVTGPRLLTFAEAVAEIVGAMGRDFQYVDIPLEEYVSQLKQYDVPKEIVALMEYLFGKLMDGRNAHVTNGVEKALDRPATDFSTFVAKAIKQQIVQ